MDASGTTREELEKNRDGDKAACVKLCFYQEVGVISKDGVFDTAKYLDFRSKMPNPLTPTDEIKNCLNKMGSITQCADTKKVKDCVPLK